MTETLKRTGREAFVKGNSQPIAARTESFVANTRLRLSATGWVADLDAVLGQEPELQPSSLDMLIANLSTRCADAYLGELLVRLEALLSDRRYYRELNARLASIAIAQLEFDGVEAIHADETAKGWYTYTAEMSAEDLASQRAWATSLQNVSIIYAQLSGDPVVQELITNTGPQRTALFQAAVSEASFVAPYVKTNDSQLTYQAGDARYAFNFMFIEDLNELQLDPANHPGPVKIFKPIPGTVYNGFPDSFQTTAFNATWRAAVVQQTSYSASISSQTAASSGAATSAQHTTTSKKALDDWNQLDVDFRRRRTQLALDVNAMRRKAQNDDRGPFNYIQELATLRANFVSRLADFYARASSIVSGLSSLWAYPSVPAVPAVHSWDDARGSYLDALQAWALQLERVIQRATEEEASAIVTLSVHSLMGDTAWKAAINVASSNPTRSLRFRIESSSFSGWAGVRIRGISASIIGTDEVEAGVWRVHAYAPQAAIVVNQRGTSHALLQLSRMLDLGRVATRQCPRPPDIAGMSQWRNLSPISDPAASDADATWGIEVAALSSNGMDVKKIKDIQLDIIVSATVI